MKRNRALLLGLVLLLGPIGCSDDFLTTVPPDEISDATFWQNSQDALLAVNAIYRDLWGAREVMNFDGMSDNAVRNIPATQAAVFIGSHDATSSWAEDSWRDAYRAIRRANLVLANIDQIQEMDPQLGERIKGEARFMRAYHYTGLVNLFGDVPLILEPLSLSESKVTRAPAAQVVDQILQDLDFAASVLPITYGAANQGRVTRGAAYALKARAALYAERWQVAADAAAEVMKPVYGYSLYPDYRALFTYAGESSPEVILERMQIKDQFSTNIFRTYAPNSVRGRSTVVPTRSIADAYLMIDGLPIEESPLYDPENPYENRDPRLDASLLRPGALFGGEIYDSRPDSETPDRLGSINFATSTGYNLLKYIDLADKDDPTNSALNFILIRYADVLLMYAEAKVELGQVDASAIEAFNQVRRRAGMPEVATLDREMVRRERRVELAFEGLRLFDIRRWGIAEHVFPGSVYGIDVVQDGVRQPYRFAAGTRFFDPARDYRWPIPQKELDLNPELGQNPGY